MDRHYVYNPSKHRAIIEVSWQNSLHSQHDETEEYYIICFINPREVDDYCKRSTEEDVFDITPLR